MCYVCVAIAPLHRGCGNPPYCKISSEPSTCFSLVHVGGRNSGNNDMFFIYEDEDDDTDDGNNDMFFIYDDDTDDDTDDKLIAIFGYDDYSFLTNIQLKM